MKENIYQTPVLQQKL